MMIRAWVWSSDENFCATFDTTRWFEDMPDVVLVKMTEAGWSGPEFTNRVVDFHRFSVVDPKITALLDYACSANQGYALKVDAEDVLAWMRATHPHLLFDTEGSGCAYVFPVSKQLCGKPANHPWHVGGWGQTSRHEFVPKNPSPSRASDAYRRAKGWA